MEVKDKIVSSYVAFENGVDMNSDVHEIRSKALENFNLDLKKLNITLEVQLGDELEVLSNLKKKDDVTVYWSKVYEPDVINKGKKIRDQFIKNEIQYKYCKGNILVEFQEMTKDDGTPYKVFTPFWKNAEKYYSEKIPPKEKIVQKCLKKKNYFENCVDPQKILPKKSWFKNFENIW